MWRIVGFELSFAVWVRWEPGWGASDAHNGGAMAMDSARPPLSRRPPSSPLPVEREGTPTQATTQCYAVRAGSVALHPSFFRDSEGPFPAQTGHPTPAPPATPYTLLSRVNIDDSSLSEAQAFHRHPFLLLHDFPSPALVSQSQP